MKKPMIFCFIRVSPWRIRFYEHNIAYLRDRLKPLDLGGYGSALPYSKDLSLFIRWAVSPRSAPSKVSGW